MTHKRNKILRALFAAFIFMMLMGCASEELQTGTASSYSNNTPGSIITVLSSNYDPAYDPDHDGDSKGYNYFPLHRAATGNKVFIFDPNYGAWAFYDRNGNRVNTGKASGGRDYCPDIERPCKTISGRFRIVAKGGPDCISSIYPIETDGGAPMPYCMYFTSSGYAVHGSDEIPDYNASHGCIRITPTAAQWLSENYITVGTTVIVLPY